MEPTDGNYTKTQQKEIKDYIYAMKIELIRYHIVQCK